MKERKDPTAFVDGYRVVRPYTPKPLTADEYYARGNRGLGFKVFALVMSVLIAVACISILTGGEPKTFLSFLEMLHNVPSITTDWLSLTNFVVDLPSWLDWLEPFANIIADLFKLLSFFVVGIIQALTFILYMLTWAFAV